MFFDLTKVYDVIDHDPGKLDHYKIRGEINVLLKSYLTLQSQCVEVTSNDKYPMNRYNSTLKLKN
jgi:hypothetical protein